MKLPPLKEATEHEMRLTHTLTELTELTELCIYTAIITTFMLKAPISPSLSWRDSRRRIGCSSYGGVSVSVSRGAFGV